jgi:DNA repair ATPase RecN
MSAINNENKELKKKLSSVEPKLKLIESRLTQKEGLITQYESEIETMTELLKDAENELDKAHKDRMAKGQSSEEVNKLNKQLHSQKVNCVLTPCLQ